MDGDFGEVEGEGDGTQFDGNEGYAGSEGSGVDEEAYPPMNGNDGDDEQGSAGQFAEEEVADVDEEDEDDDGYDEEGRVQAVSVIVRIRPLLQDEAVTADGHAAPVAVSLPYGGDPNKVRVVAKEGTPSESVLECDYDQVLGMGCSQADVFEGTAIMPAVLGVCKGVSACVFAYGQTSAGKTHTMLGEDAHGRADAPAAPSGGADDRTEWGVVPRSVAALFEELQRMEDGGGSGGGSFRYAVHASMLQIYNEQLHDLLSSSALYGEGDALKIREVDPNNDPGGGGGGGGGGSKASELYVAGLSSYRVAGVSDVLALLKHGAKARAVRATEYNEVSSRSHAILQLLVEAQTVDGDGVGTLRKAKLSMVDLAGSEKMNVAKDAPAMTKRHLQELTSINKSLSCLGNVIAVLADLSSGKAAPGTHVPYRDSKLTRLLQDSLGGSTRTVVVACVAPSSSHAPETISTLKFADRARRVMARVRPNEVRGPACLHARRGLLFFVV